MVKLFPEGDKLKGIEQLDNASGNSFYTRTEAQFFLMRIYLSERKLSKALQVNADLINGKEKETSNSELGGLARWMCQTGF